jgi:hypothetical protein
MSQVAEGGDSTKPARQGATRAASLAARRTAESREPASTHAGEDLPERQLTLAGRTQGRLVSVGDSPRRETQRSGQIIDGPDGADGWSLPQGDIFAPRQQSRQVVLVSQRQADGLDFLGRATGQIGHSSVPDFAVLAIEIA